MCQSLGPSYYCTASVLGGMGRVLAGGYWNTPPRLWFSQQFIIIQYLTRSGAFQCIIALLVQLLLLVFYILFSAMLFEGHTRCPVTSIT